METDRSDVPEDRCGFVLQPGDTPGDVATDYEAGADEWYEDSDAVCCWREVWGGGDGDRCIWHADTDDKAADELVNARADNWEVLDGAYVPAVDLGEAIDFEECRLRAATFDGAWLWRASFERVDGWAAQFPDADLSEAQFRDVNLTAARFPDADLSEAQFPEAFLGGAQFPDADLSHAQFPGAFLTDAQFPNADLSAARFPEAFLRGTQFPEADLREAQFPDAELLGAKFPAAALPDTQFPDADLREAQFPGAYLTDAQFPDADLSEAQFPEAFLGGAQFPDADLSGVVLSRSDLRATLFDGATLDEADLTDTNLEEASLIEASLLGADITGSKPLGADLAGARVDADLAFGDHYPDAPERASATYRLLEQLFRANALPGMARRAVFMRKASSRGVYSQRVSEAVARRAVGPAVTNGARWLTSQSTRVVTGYGQSPWRVVGVSFVLVVLFGALFPVWGVREGGFVYDYTDSPMLTAANARALVEGLVLSGKRFLAPSGSVQVPVGVAQAAAVVESYVGEFMFVLLAYVLGQRSAQ